MKRRIIGAILCAWVIIVLLGLSMRFYAAHRQIKIYVSRVEPMPAELADGLHMEEHKINPMVTVESDYENSDSKMLSLDEIRHIRSQIMRISEIPTFYDSLTIQDANKVLVRRTTSSVMGEYELEKSANHWILKSSEERTIMNRARQ